MPCHHPQQQRGYITDQASESLHSVRSKRAENKGRLRTLMDEQVGQGFAAPLKGGRVPWQMLITRKRGFRKTGRIALGTKPLSICFASMNVGPHSIF